MDFSYIEKTETSGIYGIFKSKISLTNLVQMNQIHTDFQSIFLLNAIILCSSKVYNFKHNCLLARKKIQSKIL